jgi:hypothetical protein
MRRHAFDSGDVLRALVVAGTLALLVLPLPTHRGADILRLESEDALVASAGWIVHDATRSPDAYLVDRAAAAATQAALILGVPDASRSLRAGSPARMRAGRAAPLRFDVHGPPAQAVLVRLLSSDGQPLDSATVTLDSDGTAEGAFRVRPATEGWHEWQVQAGDLSRPVGGWALPAAPPRVLLASGPPTWETRFVVRALEEAGATVEVRQPLGRGLTAASPRAMPANAEALLDFDVVLVMPGAELDRARRDAIADFVMQHGGGLLIAAPDPLLQRVGLAALDGDDAATGALHWRAPPEIATLPGTPARHAVQPLVALDTTAVRAAATDDTGAIILALLATGRGRTAALALRESWRWRTQEGRVDEHRAFWRSLIDWLDADAGAAVHFTGSHAAAGLRIDGTVHGHDGTPLRLARPSDSIETMHALQSPTLAGDFAIAFVPTDSGVHRVLAGDDSVLGAIRVTSAATPTGALPEMALHAHASGGSVTSSAAFGDTISALRASLPSRASNLVTLLFLLTLVLSLTDWSLRRLRGRA